MAYMSIAAYSGCELMKTKIPSLVALLLSAVVPAALAGFQATPAAVDVYVTG